MSRTETEIATQPECWRRAVELAARPDGPARTGMPRPGERVAVVGCGTSWFMGHSYAVLREAAGHGETDAFAASEVPPGRSYDRVVALSRSGTTTEVLDAIRRLRGVTPRVAVTAVTADPRSPLAALAGVTVALDFADEESVVQTRFATTELVLLRALLGEDLGHLAGQGAQALSEPLAPSGGAAAGGPTSLHGLLAAGQFTFLGRGWAYGVALEAALKLREAARVWTEAYPAMEYRHGPISIAAPGRVVWWFGDRAALPAGLADDIARTGGRLIAPGRDPLADLIVVQRLAVALASARGLDPDRPRHLTRSVILA
ncbi:sugar isomerase [Streptomyces sp. NPDC047108]|uniref:SIS domain-containing protein n=1 Tax=Streptomyces sp. NPDC047108 TaxID=3155025 RepID=UPI0033C4B9BD